MGAFLTKEEQTQQKVIFYTATVTENRRKKNATKMYILVVFKKTKPL